MHKNKYPSKIIRIYSKDEIGENKLFWEAEKKKNIACLPMLHNNPYKSKILVRNVFTENWNWDLDVENEENSEESDIIEDDFKDYTNSNVTKIKLRMCFF